MQSKAGRLTLTVEDCGPPFDPTRPDSVDLTSPRDERAPVRPRAPFGN